MTTYRIILSLLMLMTLTWCWTLIEIGKFVLYGHEISPYSWSSFLGVMNGSTMYLVVVFSQPDTNTMGGGLYNCLFFLVLTFAIWIIIISENKKLNINLK